MLIDADNAENRVASGAVEMPFGLPTQRQEFPAGGSGTCWRREAYAILLQRIEHPEAAEPRRPDASVFQFRGVLFFYSRW